MLAIKVVTSKGLKVKNSNIKNKFNKTCTTIYFVKNVQVLL